MSGSIPLETKYTAGPLCVSGYRVYPCINPLIDREDQNGGKSIARCNGPDAYASAAAYDAAYASAAAYDAYAARKATRKDQCKIMRKHFQLPWIESAN